MVKLVSNKRDGKRYALKVYEKHRLNDPMKKKAVQREIAALKKMNHPNVVGLVELIETSRTINLVMDYVQGVSL